MEDKFSQQVCHGNEGGKTTRENKTAKKCKNGSEKLLTLTEGVRVWNVHIRFFQNVTLPEDHILE